MRDDWFGHRNPLTGAPYGDKDEWIDWDHLLIDVYQTIEDYTDEYGLLAWELDDDLVEVDAVKRIHKFKQSVEQRTAGSAKKPYKSSPGEYFVPKVFTRRSDGEYQTYQDWIEKQILEDMSE